MTGPAADGGTIGVAGAARPPGDGDAPFACGEAERRLAARGLVVPRPVGTRFRYEPALVDGRHVYLGGQLAKTPDDAVLHVGTVGVDVTLADAQAAAAACALQALAWIRHVLGTLDRVERVLRLSGYVRVPASGHDRMSDVIDSASGVLIEAFGPSGRHVRSVLGVVDLPRHASVMIDLVVTARPGD